MDADFSGPRRGADRAVLLAHGAGSDCNAKPLVALADGLATAGKPEQPRVADAISTRS